MNNPTFPATQPALESETLLVATIRTERGETVTLSFKDMPLTEVRERVAAAGRIKYPYGFTFTIREV